MRFKKKARNNDTEGLGETGGRVNFSCDFQKGEKLSRQEVKAMIDEVDENKDGRLDYKEVC